MERGETMMVAGRSGLSRATAGLFGLTYALVGALHCGGSPWFSSGLFLIGGLVMGTAAYGDARRLVPGRRAAACLNAMTFFLVDWADRLDRLTR